MSLEKLDAFQFLGRAIEHREVRMREALITQLMSGTRTMEEMQRDIDHSRGFIAGMRYATRDVTAGAQRDLDKLDKGTEPDEPEQEDYWNEPDRGSES